MDHQIRTDYSESGAGNINSAGKVKKVTVDAVIIRADGSRVDLGTIYERDYSFIGYIKSLWRRFTKWRMNRAS